MKQFLPFLTDDQGRSLKEEDAVVVTRSIPDPLDNAPDGWENNTLQWTRNTEFKGIIKAYTTSLKFYLEGAKILRNAFYRMGMETILYFIWLKQNTAFGAGMKYEGWYKGEPDFGTFKDEYDGVEISITEGGFYKDLQANKGVINDIPFDNDADMLFMDGMNLNNNVNYEIQNNFSSGLPYDFLFMPLTFLTNNGSSVGLTFYSQFGQTTSSPDFLDAQKYFLRSTINVTLHFIIDIQFVIIGGVDMVVSFYLQDQTAPVEIMSPPTSYSPSPIPYKLHFEFDLAVTANQNLFFMSGGMASVDPVEIIFQRSDFKITVTSRADANVIPVYRAVVLGNKLTGKVSSGATMTSPLLDNDFNLMITCGDAIRNLPGAVIKTSLSDWDKSVDAVKCIALDVVNNNPVVYSRYDKFNKASSISSLGECSNWTLEPADPYIYDSVEAGYPSKSSQSNDDVNGKYSFNNTYEWVLNVTRRKVNKYLMLSAYYADPYDIELIRVNFNNKDTTTANTDNSVFFIDAEPKLDAIFSGVIHFYHSDNKIELNGDITTIAKFMVPGVKINITGSLLNNSKYTITAIVDQTDFTDVVFSVLEMVSATEDIVGTATAVNLYKLRRLPYSTIDGIPNDGTVFNIELSPRRNLQNHLRWLRGSFHHLDMYKLMLASTDKNKNLVTTDAGGNVISESADIPVSSMGDPVFWPYFTTFNIKSPYNLKALVDANNSGKFDYTRSDLPFDGFIEDIKTNDATLETQEFKLLVTANNDLTTLINNR